MMGWDYEDAADAAACMTPEEVAAAEREWDEYEADRARDESQVLRDAKEESDGD